MGRVVTNRRYKVFTHILGSLGQLKRFHWAFDDSLLFHFEFMTIVSAVNLRTNVEFEMF